VGASMNRRAIGVPVGQADKKVRRSARAMLLLFALMVRIRSSFPGLLRYLLRVVPKQWVGKNSWLCVRIGHQLLQLDRPAEAWPWFEEGLRSGYPSTDDFLISAMCLYHGLGRFRDAMALLTRANEQSLERARVLGVDAGPYRVLGSVWVRHIGHIATLDYVIKLGLLEGRSREHTVLYLPPGSPVANRFLLQQMAAHLRVIENPTDLPFDESAVQILHYDYLGPRLPDRTTAYFWTVAAETQRRWHDSRRASLLTLPPEIEARGWAALHRAGIPRGAWFVALHVREGTWDGRNPGLHGMLNADIATYQPAIAEITRRGGWVIRMGDPRMRRLRPTANVLDYCHSDLRADWMDIFLAARCRFMLGTSSGPAYLPGLYGVPSVLTNWWPPAQRPWHPTDLFIPKMLRHKADGRYLSLAETLAEPFSYCHSVHYLADVERVHVEDNDSGLIRAAVAEMLNRLEGGTSRNPELDILRAQADTIYRRFGALGMAQLTAGFVKVHSDLLQ
jgi:putative glycosyltransferase (TIGR04372 family)